MSFLNKLIMVPSNKSHNGKRNLVTLATWGHSDALNQSFHPVLLNALFMREGLPFFLYSSI